MSGQVAGAELLLPLSYIFETSSFRLKGYSVLVGERPGLRAGGVWPDERDGAEGTIEEDTGAEHVVNGKLCMCK